ncbi:MAG: hypothetical protein FWH14_04740 [Oscillospiraceae bacterium]|nr:hypothetical protein [Oscillospiraceae bacterium]
MKSKFKITVLTLLLCICVTVSSLPASALTFGENKTFNADMKARKETVFAEQISIMEQNHLELHGEEDAISLNISEIKDVYDFAKNKFTLVELHPQGYILFHDESGLFVEYSSRTPSPYHGIFTELYYAGIKEYYSKDLSNDRSLSNNTEYKHTVLEKTLSEDDVSDYENISNTLNNALIAEKNENILNYIQKNTPLQLDNRNVPQNDTKDNVDLSRTTYNGIRVVKDYTFFTRLNNCGDIGGGRCGYIAAGMLLAYRQYAFGGIYIPQNQLLNTSSVRVCMQTFPNPNGPRIEVTSNGTGLYYTISRVANGSVLGQGYLASSSNSWNFALLGLAAGHYRLDIQAVGPGGVSNCEIQTFTIGTSGVRAYMETLPNPAGPRIMVTSTGTGLYYTVRRVSNNSVLEQGYLASSSNSWNFALWGLAAGQYRLEIQAVGSGGASNIEASTFTINNPAISTSLPTDLYATGVKLGYGNSTTSREIRFTVNRYLSDKGYAPVSYTEDWIPLANNIRIANHINDDKPVIWFGQIINNTHDNQTFISHAIVTYGYSFSWGTYSFLAHFGWTNATEVYFNGILGSMYSCWR